MIFIKHDFHNMQIKIMDTKLSFWATTVLLLTIFIEHTSVAKKLNASQAFDDTWNTATDLENELEQKRSVKSNTATSTAGTGGASGGGGASASALTSAPGQWLSWSDWSTCSRTCDGGIMQQIRRCNNANGCKGENVRYRICNMQPCPEQQDFRAHQCAAYNDVPYDGTLYKWTPHYDYVEPCALTCRGRPAHLPDDLSPETEGAEDTEHYDEPSVIVQLSARVQDGTRCRSGSLDMCIQGKCQRVGCDLKIGSAKKIDGCGVCGGDGNSCTQALYHWETAPMSLCSVTCGGGYKMSRSVCRNRLTGIEVDESLCSIINRPEPAVELCNSQTCAPRWIADEWSPCSRLCGTGYRERMVVCAEESNGIKTRVSDIMCRRRRPPTQESCIIEECPKWEIEDWSGCSVSCGQGIKMRGVECKSTDGRLSAKCDPNTKPETVQQCSTGISCDGGSRSETGGAIIMSNSGPRSMDTGLTDDSDVDEDDEDEDADEDEDEREDESGAGIDEDFETVSYNDQPTRYSHNTISRLQHEEIPEPRMQSLSASISDYGQRRMDLEPEMPSAEPTFIKDTEWSPCSVTCGEGVRRRSYKCKIFLEYSRTIATVNDTLCEGPKPHDDVERCVVEPCMLPSHGYEEQYPRDSIKVGVSEPGKTYVWREQGYTSCSASCLGGVEELIINCVREDNGRVVSPFLCAPETKPEARVRTCNDRPCPPRWNYSDYTPCSKSCGIGIKTREVQCIHEVTRGGENTMMVPNSMCPQPPPADRQYCNVLDCPVRWEVGEWSKCSHTCGYGIKDRKVECKQIMAQEHKIERPEAMCPSVKPPDKKPCNVKPCPPEDPKPIISISNTTHIQHDPKKSKITLKVGGAGVVFFGTQVKIKCPVKRFNRTKIKWSKDHKPLVRSRKFKVSKKGALRILDITFRDAGVYSCHAGLSSAEIHIEVKAKPGQQTEDLERQESERLVRERSGTEPLTSADMTALDGVNGSQTTRRKQQNGRERSRRPKSDGVQHADSGIIEDEQKSQLVQQAQDGLPQPASASSGSGSSRTHSLLAMPYFQALLSNLQYLWPLQKFSNSKGHQMLSDNELSYDGGGGGGGGVDFNERYEQDEPVKLQIATKSLSDLIHFNGQHTRQAPITDATTTTTSAATATATSTKSTTTTNEPQIMSQTMQSHKGRWKQQNTNTNNNNNNVDIREMTTDADDEVENLKFIFKWFTGNWTECSQKCDAGGAGLKHRAVTCVQMPTSSLSSHQDNIANLVVANAFCEQNIDNEMPAAFETCGNAECPHWQIGEWTLCARSRCFDRNTAIQRREVYCRYANETPANGCDEYERPVSRQECYNERCKGVWRVEPWSKCNAPCGRKGIKYRIVQCVWYGTRKPAGNACRQLPPPVVMKVCHSPPCMELPSYDCRDRSMYCSHTHSRTLCRQQRYLRRCCGSCKRNHYT